MTLRYIACAKNENEGEQITRIFLVDALKHTDGTLFGNYHLPVNNGTRECDLVLFNKFGVWILEVKNWRGLIKIDQRSWQRDDGLIQQSPLINVEIKAKKLATVLENAGFRNISVVGLVVLAQSSAKLQNTDDVNSRDPRQDKIFHLGDRLIRAITGRKYLYKMTNRELNFKLIKKISDMLVPRFIDPEQKRIGDSYLIVYDLGSGPNEVFHMYKAVHMNIPGRYVRAKKYSTQNAFSTEDLKNAISRFQRDMQALVKLEHHPNIVRVYDYQPDYDSNDIYWLLLEWVKGNTLRDRIEIGPDILFQEQLHILRAILNALDCCHSNGILHRNLTPSCIYLADDGTVKLGDFDFARVPDLKSTLTLTDQPLPVEMNRLMAPELQTNARAADVRSDLYALGAIWYDMIVRPESDEKIDLQLLEEQDISIDAHDLLVRLLATDPGERPKNANAVKRWLDQV